MIQYKEFEILRCIMKGIGSNGSNDDIAKNIYEKTCYNVFKNEEEVLNLYHSLVQKGYLKGVEITREGINEIKPLKVNNAIILAAGGADITAKSIYSQPKGLFVKDGETLIERQICQLREVGINEITVVVGYKQEMYYFLMEKYNVHMEINTDWKKNNIYSLYCAKNYLGNTYICNCDNFFPENPFSQYEYSSYHATTIKNNATNELLVRKNEFGRILEVYSGAPSGECIYGHAYLDAKFSKRLIKYMNLEINNFRTSVMFWEEFVNKHIDNLDMYAREYKRNFIYEFETIQEIQNVESLFLDKVSSSINKTICKALKCQILDITDINILQKGLSNILFTFVVTGTKYIFRYPGDSTSFFIYRKNENRAQQIATKSGVDETNVYIDERGMKISVFRDKSKNIYDYYYKDIETMKTIARKIRKFHDAGYDMSDWKDFVYNPIEQADMLMHQASVIKGDLFKLFKKEHDDIVRLFNYTERDGIHKTMCHNDLNADNILMTDTTLDIIDWEFAGWNDPAYDFGRVIGNYDYDSHNIDTILEAYFGRKATKIERLHWIAYIAIHNWYYLNWALYKESISEYTRDWMLYFYKYSKKAMEYALPRYEKFYGK